MLDARRIEEFIRLKSIYGNSNLIPKDASNTKVLNLKNISGGLTNELYSFSLTFSRQGLQQHLDLILKTYPETVALWFKTYRPNEEVRKYIREFQVMSSLYSVGFPVPHVYLCECDPFFIGYPFTIMDKENVVQESTNNLHLFAETLARLHNLKAEELGIKSFAFPHDDSAFAREWPIRFKHAITETKHYRSLKKTFEYAISWLESNADQNKCPVYCLIHGEYHPGHTIITNDNTMKVIDWEGAAIGDPACDVGYAYHMVKLMCNAKNPNSGERAADQFIPEYQKNFQGNIQSRLKFYQVVGIVGVTIAVSSVISNPLEANRRFGRKAFARALAFPYLRSNAVGKKWLNADFVVSYLQYCHDFLKTTLRE
jgi:aminoglycoside phosphotransferase (APT) family kinase protein